MRSCGITDERLFEFADGVQDETLEEHVATCDECQSFLADLWIGESPRDLSAPVMRIVRFDEFLVAAAKLGVDVAGAMGKAVVEMGPNADRV